MDAYCGRNYGTLRATVHFARKSMVTAAISLNSLCYEDLYENHVNRTKFHTDVVLKKTLQGHRVSRIAEQQLHDSQKKVLHHGQKF